VELCRIHWFEVGCFLMRFHDHFVFLIDLGVLLLQIQGFNKDNREECLINCIDTKVTVQWLALLLCVSEILIAVQIPALLSEVHNGFSDLH
jgi:hypothetical protein